jgi:hypothetical protein
MFCMASDSYGIAAFREEGSATVGDEVDCWLKPAERTKRVGESTEHKSTVANTT